MTEIDKASYVTNEAKPGGVRHRGREPKKLTQGDRSPAESGNQTSGGASKQVTERLFHILSYLKHLPFYPIFWVIL
jgi:hypothetical protein